MPRLMSFAKTWGAFVSGEKTVTRRSRLIWKDPPIIGSGEHVHVARRRVWAAGWATLKPGDIIQGIEWLPRWPPHGERWVCPDCGWLGPTDPSLKSFEDRRLAHGKAHPECDGGTLLWRAPERLPGTEGHRRIVSIRDEMLADITADDVTREGFPGKSPLWFAEMYCGGKLDIFRPVNRIEFEELAR